MAHKPINVPLTFVTALLVTLIAGLAGSTLVLLRSLHRQTAHEAATQEVIERGQAMVARLATQPSVTSLSPNSEDWQEFSRLVKNLHILEDELQYVSVTRDDVVMFHEQTRLLDGRQTPTDTMPVDPTAVDIHREILNVGDEKIPVVVFKMAVTTPSNTTTRVNVALRKDMVRRKEAATGDAITSMFRLTLLTIVISFTICIALVVWMMRRETRREALRREEEHLAFSGMLANGIVHDFRNPMSSMRLDVQMLKRETEKGEAARPERMQELATRTRNTLDRMDKIFQEFLYASRPDRAERVSFDVITCIRDSLNMLTPRFERAKVTPRLSAPDGELPVLAYEASLRRAIVNILTNAEQFSPEGEFVDVHIEKAANTVIIEISDRGPGIPKQKRKQVFDMFETERPEGTGLGLFIAKAAIERSGGSIEVVDKGAAPGTCIRIRLHHGTAEPHTTQT